MKKELLSKKEPEIKDIENPQTICIENNENVCSEENAKPFGQEIRIGVNHGPYQHLNRSHE